MTQTRRNIIRQSLVGSAALGLRALASGIPVGALQLMQIPSAHALDLAAATQKPQYLLLNLSSNGDPFNANCPGSYDATQPGIFNNPNGPTTSYDMTPVAIQLGSQQVKAAKPWATLPQWALDRTTFIHHRTYQNIHPQFANVMSLVGSSRGPMGETSRPDDIASIISYALAQPSLLGCIQPQPMNFSAPSVKYQGQVIQRITPSALKGLFADPAAAEKQLRTLRDQDVNKFYTILKSTGGGAVSPSQVRWLDEHAKSQTQVRSLSSDVIQQLGTLTGLDSNLQTQIDAALLAFKLNITAVATVSIAFGGDNHNDAGLTQEAQQTYQGIADLNYFFTKLQAMGLTDQVTLANLAVFGRTLKQSLNAGRSHNLNHHVMAITGLGIKPGVVGGIVPADNDFGAGAFDSRSGMLAAAGDVPVEDGLESAARTLGASLGVPQTVLDTRIRRKNPDGIDVAVGKSIKSALAV